MSEPQSSLNPIPEISNALRASRVALSTTLRNKRAFYFIAALMAAALGLHHYGVWSISIWFRVPIWGVGLLLLIAAWGLDVEKLKIDIDSYESLRRLYLGISESDSDTHFDKLVKINISNLDAYYSLVKSHTGASFRLAAVVGVVGFLLLAAGIALSFVAPEHRDVVYLTAGAGILTEFISGVFFYLYNKTVRQLKDYHDSLLGVQNVLLSFKLIEDTSDPAARSTMIGRMIDFLMLSKTDANQALQATSVAPAIFGKVSDSDRAQRGA